MATEHWNRAALERNLTDVAGTLAMEVVDVEEEIDRRLVPPEPNLPVALDCPSICARDEYARRERLEDVGHTRGREEDVQVDITRSARLLRAVRERDGAAERMR